MVEETRNRGRPRGFDEDTALEAAMLTFWKKGYRNTSLDDLVERTGASRASLYKTFGDKRDIFIASLDLYGSRFEKRALAVLASDEDMMTIARTLLTASAERLAGSDAPAGCLRCNSTLEVLGSDEAIDRALNRANERFLQIMEKVVERGVQRGDVPPERKEDLAVFLTGAVGGMVSLARSDLGRDALLAFVETTLSALREG